MAPAFQYVSLTDIACDGSPFVVTYRPDLQALRRSVARAGVRTPVHLRQEPGQPGYQVICGAKRLQACQSTGRAAVPALIHRAAELSHEQAFLLAVYDNVGCRTLNAVEKARILLRLRDEFGYATAVLTTEFCPLLDLPPQAETLAAYCTLATLAEALQAGVVDGDLPFDTALWIGRQPPADLPALLALFTGLKLGSNRAREFVAMLEDICRRDGSNATEVLQALHVPAILAVPHASGPQKIGQVRRVLHTARYPRFSAHERQFQETLRQLRLPSPVQLRPPPYFEGQQYQVTFGFRTRQELQQYAQRLLDAAAHPACDDLLALL
jgi:hypothetical protein